MYSSTLPVSAIFSSCSLGSNLDKAWKLLSRPRTLVIIPILRRAPPKHKHFSKYPFEHFYERKHIRLFVRMNKVARRNSIRRVSPRFPFIFVSKTIFPLCSFVPPLLRRASHSVFGKLHFRMKNQHTHNFVHACNMYKT